MIKYPMQRSIFLLAFTVFIVSCEWEEKYPGFSKSRDGYYYKLNKIGEGAENASVGDYITVDLNYKTLNDSVFFHARRKFQLTRPSFKGSIDHCFMILSQGDAASFIISASDFFSKTLETSLPSFLLEGDQMMVDAEMIEIQTEKDYLNEKKAFLSWIEDFGEYEKVLLSRYFETEQLEAEPTESGLYILNLKEGTGELIARGDTVEVHYEGRFLNGKFFDSTKMRNEAFQFVYGQEWQVVEGLEEAIGRMRSGERSLVILPSRLGFGETGSSTGIVPPFTSLIYEVEIKSVR